MIVNEQAVSVHLPREEEREKEGKEECEDKKTEGEGQVKCKIAETKKGTEEAGTQTRAEEEVYICFNDLNFTVAPTQTSSIASAGTTLMVSSAGTTLTVSSAGTTPNGFIL